MKAENGRNRLGGPEMKKRNVSLSIKLDILLAAIVLITSMVLVNIGYHSYSETLYAQLNEKLARFEQNIEKDAFMVQKYGSVAYKAAQLDGFDEVRRQANELNDPAPLTDWMKQQLFGYTTGEHLTRAQFDARHRELMQQAAWEGVSEEDAEDWILQRDPLLYDFADVGNAVNLLSYYMQIDADSAAISHVRVYAEDEKGYLQLTDSAASSLRSESADYMFYGRRPKEVRAISTFAAQKKRLSFRTEEGDSEELTQVVPLDIGGIRYWVVYSCDTAPVRAGQSDYLVRSLVLVLIMVVIAIAAGLIVLRRMVNKPLKSLTRATTRFGAGENGYSKADVIDLDIRSKNEIGDLYREIRAMQTRIVDNTENLTRMTAEKERIGTELGLARRIQADMLPNDFPAYPDRTEFRVFASMTPAREVGGDFYDFFLIDGDRLALVIADVSGKGVPGALFMMASKLLIQNIAMSGLSPAEILETANRRIRTNNKEDMFVTVWLGILEISTGRMTCANAGHEYPALKTPDGNFELYKDKHGFVLGGMDGMKYRNYELDFAPGQKLFVYTDGATEATDAAGNLFGTERLIDALNKAKDLPPEEILPAVRKEIDDFVGEEEQFDDLTMLCLEYRGK